MAYVECQHEGDVLLMVQTGRWPNRVAPDLAAHVAGCQSCAEVALAASAVEADAADIEVPALPSSGTVWWRAQLRARQDAAREVVRPITATQALAFAAVVGSFGAVFGATTTWFQDALRWFGGALGRMVSGHRLPQIPSLPQDLASVWVGYWVVLLVACFGLIAGALVLRWAMKEE